LAEVVAVAAVAMVVVVEEDVPPVGRTGSALDG
jgi:hypothetical protein